MIIKVYTVYKGLFIFQFGLAANKNASVSDVNQADQVCGVSNISN